MSAPSPSVRSPQPGQSVPAAVFLTDPIVGPVEIRSVASADEKITIDPGETGIRLSTPLVVGDDTDYIRINPTAGKIEFGGTMRPPISAPLLGNMAHLGQSNIILVGSGTKQRWVLRFDDNDSTTSLGSQGHVIGAHWDLSEPAVVKCMLSANSALTTPNDVGIFEASISAHRAGTRFDNQTELSAGTDIELDFDSAGVYVPRVFTLLADIDMSGCAVGDVLSFWMNRKGADTDDVLGTIVYLHGAWLETKAKSVGFWG